VVLSARRFIRYDAGMIVILIVMLLVAAIAFAPVWPHSKTWSWWPSAFIWAIGLIVAALLLIERIEAM